MPKPASSAAGPTPESISSFGVSKAPALSTTSPARIVSTLPSRRTRAPTQRPRLEEQPLDVATGAYGQRACLRGRIDEGAGAALALAVAGIELDGRHPGGRARVVVGIAPMAGLRGGLGHGLAQRVRLIVREDVQRTTGPAV